MKNKDYHLSISTIIYLLIRSNYIEKRSYWWENLIKILKKKNLRILKKSLKVTRFAASDPFVRTGDHARFESLLHKAITPLPSLTIVNFSNENYSELPIPTIKSGMDSNQVPGEQNISIEYVKNYYTEQNWKICECGDSLLTSIYGVLMWEFIYDDSMEFVFQTSYQVLPLDFKSEDFFRRRQKKFKELAESLIDPEKACNIFENNYMLHFNENSSIIKWELLESMIVEDLFFVIHCLGKSLIKILKVFSKDFKNNSSGMPDYLLFNDAEIKFVKVNKDKVTDQQEIWIRRLVKYGFKVELLHMASVNENRS